MLPSLIARKCARMAKPRGLALCLSLLVFAVGLPLGSQAQIQSSDLPDSSRKRAPVEFVPGEILVRYRSEAAAARSEAAGTTRLMTDRGNIAMTVERFEGSDLVEGLRLARVSPEDTLPAIAAFNARPDVVYAEPNYIRRKLVTPNDPRLREMWGLKNTGQAGTSGGNPGTVGADIDAEPAWNLTTGSRNVVVGVIDEGIDVGHPDLQANIWRNPGETPNNGVDDDANGFADDVNGWDFFHNDRTVFDGSGAYPSDDTDAHGTHVAGTIGARGNNMLGVVGVNWEVSLISLKILGREGEAMAPSSVRITVRAYSYAKMMRDRWTSSGGARGANIRVLNNSYGGGGRSQAEMDAIRALDASGILFVAAAGNDSNNNDVMPVFPASYATPNMISVAATNNSDTSAYFTNFGARTVSMAAPGEWILSTTPNGTYNFFSGTSMASPHVAGAAALVCAANPSISVRRLRAALMYSGDVLETQNFHTLLISGRRLSALKALRNVSENDTTPPAAVRQFEARSVSDRKRLLTWIAPGDNGNIGRAAIYEIRFSDTEVTTAAQFEQARPLEAPLPEAAGTHQDGYIQIPYRHPAGFAAIRALDNVGNAGPITSVPVPAGVETIDPYVVTESAATALSTGGVPIHLNGDDLYRNDHSLPFAFPYFGHTAYSVSISTNGALYVPYSPQTINGTVNDAGSSADGLNAYRMIAGIWDDLRTDRRAGDDVYVVKPDATRIIFRWQAVTFNTPLSPTSSRGENPVNFEIELNRNGTITVRYGAGNQKLFPVVGISGGAPDAYLVPSHTSETSLKSLANAQTVVFRPRGVVAPEDVTVESLTLNPASVIGGKSTTGKVILNAPAPLGGRVVALSDNIAATTVPASITVPAGVKSKTFTITTTGVAAAQSGTVTAKVGTVAKTAALVVRPVALASVALSSNSVAGGNPVTGTVTLNGTAPAGGIVVALADALTSTTVPASVTVPAGATSQTFKITTATVTARQSGQLRASHGGVDKYAPLEVRPVGVLSVSVNPNPIMGGQSATGTVVLERAAPGDVTVALSETVTAATIPASVVVLKGATSKTFPVTTTAVTAFQSGNLTASLNGVSKSVAFAVNQGACAGTTFKIASELMVGWSAQSVLTDDFNGDGKLDLVVSKLSMKQVAIMLGDGVGGFGAPTNFAVRLGPSGMATADFNQDGNPDLAVLSGGPASEAAMSIFLGDGRGGLGRATNFPTGSYPTQVAVGDFNKDLKADLAVTTRSNSVSIFLGNGQGGFSPRVDYPANIDPRGIAVGDFNGDRKMDLVVASFADNRISTLLGNGTGGFAAPTSRAVGSGAAPYYLAVSDFNKDGHQDLAVTFSGYDKTGVMLGDGAGGFGAPTKYPVGAGPQKVVARDLNADGNVDLVVTSHYGDKVSVLFGTATGRFNAAVSYPLEASSGPSGAAAGDFNGDGKPDLAVANYRSGKATILFNTCR